MPTLKKYISKTGYYIKGFVPGRGQNSTLQVTPQALQLIQAEIGRDEGKFSAQLLRNLLAAKLVFSKGEYPLARLPAISVTREAMTPTLTRHAAARLVFVENDTDWQLALRIDALPQKWIAQASNLVEVLANWSIRLPGAAPVPAMQLWPGRGGMVIHARPQQLPYRLTLEGRWPEAWDVPTWLSEVPGLSAGITLFHAVSGERIDPGAALEPGGAYVLVAQSDPKFGAVNWGLQSFLSPHALGRIGAWHAWVIELPSENSPRVQAWCETFGFRLAEPQFKLILISSPARFNDAGLPVVHPRHEVVLGLLPVSADQTQNDEPVFYTTTFAETGSFQITLGDKASSPLRIVVEERTPKAWSICPEALTVQLTWPGGQVSLRALHNGIGPHELPAELLHETPRVQVCCPAPLALTWAVGAERGRRERLAADEAAALIAELLQTAVHRQTVITLQLDVGPYGRLALKSVPESPTVNTTAKYSLLVTQRARWLATILSASPHREPAVPLAATTQHVLARLAEVPGCATLGYLRTVPAWLIAHVHALTRLVL
jgi:hypothetical protein